MSVDTPSTAAVNDDSLDRALATDYLAAEFQHCATVFPKGGPHTVQHRYGTADAILERKGSVPPERWMLLEEMVLMGMEYAAKHFQVNGDTLREFQRALLTEFIQMFADEGDTFLLEGLC